MLKLCRVTKVKVFFLVLVYVFNFDLFEFSARAILEKGLFKFLPHTAKVFIDSLTYLIKVFKVLKETGSSCLQVTYSRNGDNLSRGPFLGGPEMFLKTKSRK